MSEGVERLRFMLGRLSGDERADGGVSTGELVARLAVGGRAVVSDYVQRVDTEVVFEGHGVYTFDASMGQYVMTWFDSAGGGRPVIAHGVFEGSRLTFEASREGIRSRYVYDVRETGYDLAIRVSVDGSTWQTFLEASYARA